MLKTMTVRATIAAILAGLSMSAYAIADSPKSVDIPAGDLRQALLKVSEQFGADLVFSPEQVQGLKTGGAHGELTTERAVTKLLEGTPLELRTDPSGAMLIAPPAAKEAPQASTHSERPKSLLSRLRLAQSETPSPSKGEGQGEDRAQAAGDQRAETPAQSPKVTELEEIVVTGTHLRGTAPVGSQLIVLDREAIDRSGFASLPQLLQSLPQNFVGGSSEQGAALGGSRNGNNLNFAKGSGVNLRGLGNDSTLVLLNGRRIAASGVGDFVDLSMLPLAAVERIEVLADGASAVYGSDAVGGVVNVVLRDDYEGAETRMRYGSVTSGSSDELQASQLFGTAWAGGGAMVNYEYYRRNRLDAADRHFTSPQLTNGGTISSDLLPQQVRQSLFASAKQALGDRARLFATSYLSDRDTDSHDYNPLTLRRSLSDIDSRQVGGTLGASLQLAGDWQAELAANYGRNQAVSWRTDNDVRAAHPAKSRSMSWSVETKADGSLFHAPGGDIRLALGAQYRKEDLSLETSGTPSGSDRDVSAAFGELLIPLARTLDLTAAARYERYSDFGDTTNPHAGLMWSPLEGLDLRASWGTSFRAPLLYEKDQSQLGAILVTLPDPGSPTGISSILGVFGSAVPDLGPENATTWTAGIDIRPASVPGLDLRITWFDIDYEDRIEKIDAGLGYAALFNPQAFGSLVSRPGDPALIAVAASLPPGTTTGTFINLAGVPLASTQVSIDNRLRNLASTQVDGLDVNVRYAFETRVGRWSFDLNSSYLFSFDNHITSTSPVNEVLNTVYNPVDWRVRSSVGWARTGWAVTSFLNYTGDYTNNLSSSKISSWTTADLQMSCDIGQVSGSKFGSGAVLSLSVLNVFDRDPPRIIDLGSFGDAGYDAQNASPLGRFIALQITKSWGVP